MSKDEVAASQCRISTVYAILSAALSALDSKPKGKHRFLFLKIPAILLDAEEIRGYLKRYCKIGK